jgi:drug/metabolite transporter (DMT)-like permease
MQSLFVDGLIGTICLIFQIETTTGIVTPDIIFPGILAGVISGVGIVLINYSVTVGIAGPASALANLAAVFQTLLDFFLLGQVLNLMQIVGLVVGLSGAMVLAVGLPIYHKVKGLFVSKKGRLNKSF